MFDARELQGEWEVVSCNCGSVNRDDKQFKSMRWMFAGTSRRVVTSRGVVYGPDTIRVDASRDPSEVDAMNKRQWEVISTYRRTGDVFVWAEWERGRKPSSFEPAPGAYLWTLRRVKG